MRKCYDLLLMPLRICTVSFKSPTGISHGVDVEAETLYEAAGLGFARLKKDEGARWKLIPLVGADVH